MSQESGTQVRYWGTRGSLPSPGPETVVFGGNTSCVEIRADGARWILDTGTGVRNLGAAMAREDGDLKATASGGVVDLPADAPDQVDYEGEVAIVIGRRARQLDREEAHAYIAGVSSVIDLTARDVQLAAMNSPDGLGVAAGVAKSKSFPGFKPFGPGIELLNAEELAEKPLLWELRTARQCASSHAMRWRLIEQLTI